MRHWTSDINTYMFDRIERSDDSCYIWQGSYNSDGYPLVRKKGYTGYAHRIAYTLAVGAIPEGQEIHHTCARTGCVNPAHMRLIARDKHRQMPRRTRVRSGDGYAPAIAIPPDRRVHNWY